MKRIIIICILVLVLVMSFAACSKKDGAEQVTETPTVDSVEVCTAELVYKINEDGQSYTLISAGKCTCEEIVIPETYNNLPVTCIGDSAFNRCSTLKSVTIPSSVTEIWHRAFLNCHSLEDVNIPASVTAMGYYVFSGCKSLKSITIPTSVTYIGGNAFQGCDDITVNCEAEAQPSEWDKNWNAGATVNWGCKE